ncbi:unnamed protein product [Ectocarpus sp. 4 AP-2014]
MDSASSPDTRALDLLSSLPADKKIRLSGGTTTTNGSRHCCTQTVAEAPPSPSSSSPAPTAQGRRLGILPGVVLREIVSFTTDSSLSGVCRTALVAIRELHYKVDMANNAFRGAGADPAGADLANHVGLEASGALATGRAVVRITITTVIESANESRHHARYKALEQAVGRVVRHSIPTLREITIRGCPTWNGRARYACRDTRRTQPGQKSRIHMLHPNVVAQTHLLFSLFRSPCSVHPFILFSRMLVPSHILCARLHVVCVRSRVGAILGELVPLSAKRHRVAPRLSRVHLVDGATGVAKAGRAVAAGLWPALEELTFSHCRANAGHFRDLARGLRSGLAPRLRVLGWDDQSSVREASIDDVILGALSWGKCPLVERLSFTGNRFCPEHSIGYLEEALWVCPRLRELRMDCSRTPHRQLRVLAGALAGGHVPCLERLLVRATATYYRDSDVELLSGPRLRGALPWSSSYRSRRD